jgi:hypothetical protein
MSDEVDLGLVEWTAPALLDGINTFAWWPGRKFSSQLNSVPATGCSAIKYITQSSEIACVGCDVLNIARLISIEIINALIEDSVAQQKNRSSDGNWLLSI